MTYIHWPELHSPANGRVWGRRFETHTLPVGRLDILERERDGEREERREGGKRVREGGRVGGKERDKKEGRDGRRKV